MGNAGKSRKNKREKARKNKVTVAGRSSVQDGKTAQDLANLNLILGFPIYPPHHVENGGGKINLCPSLLSITNTPQE